MDKDAQYFYEVLCDIKKALEGITDELFQIKEILKPNNPVIATVIPPEFTSNVEQKKWAKTY